MDKISVFRDENRWLSNFAYGPFWYKGVRFDNVEQAFQAEKFSHLSTAEAAKAIGAENMEKYHLSMSDNKLLFHYFAQLKAVEAKKASHLTQVRPDWDTVKFDIMHKLVDLKFTSNPHLMAKLLSTGDAELIEGNYWHDNTWGMCSCYRCRNIASKNMLGKILMEVRTAHMPA